MRVSAYLIACLVTLSCVAGVSAGEAPRFPASARNLLVDAKVSSNLAAYKLGLRGGVRDMIFDIRKGAFVRASQWHEYGVGFGKEMGIVPESKPAWWMARWARPVSAKMIVLSGTYPNQPQPETCWKIEVGLRGKWTTHARGKGGWYNKDRYVWGGPAARPLEMDAIRISVFSKDDKTPIKSIHFRGEKGISWVVADLPPIDARIALPRAPIRAGAKVTLSAKAVAGKIESWEWAFGDGAKGKGPKVSHAYAAAGVKTVRLTFSDGKHTATVERQVTVVSPVEARIDPLTGPVMAGRPVDFAAAGSVGRITKWAWDFGDGTGAKGAKVRHTFAKGGIYRVKLSVSDGRHAGDGWAIVRAHTPKTLHVPQIFLDTDQKNEQDDQHYFGYSLFSELDQLGVNSVHHGGGQEPVNYREILNVLGLAADSGLPPIGG